MWVLGTKQMYLAEQQMYFTIPTLSFNFVRVAYGHTKLNR